MHESATRPPEPVETETSESWFENVLEPCFEKALKTVEFVTVIGLAAVILMIAFYEAYWVMWGCTTSNRQTRIQNAVTAFSGNWKIGLLLLIPLFYRTIRTFLERAEKIAGIEAPRTPTAIRSGKLKPNPPNQES
jgi:hypothetical protein